MCSLPWTKQRKAAWVPPHSKEHILVTCAVWGLILSRPMEIGHMCHRWDLWGFWPLCWICFWKCSCWGVVQTPLSRFPSCGTDCGDDLWGGSFGVGKGGLKVGGQPAHRGLPGSLVFIVSLHRQAGPWLCSNFSSPLLLYLLFCLRMAPQLVYQTPLWAEFIVINCHQGSRLVHPINAILGNGCGIDWFLILQYVEPCWTLLIW